MQELQSKSADFPRSVPKWRIARAIKLLNVPELR
jgi:hypothetical protein